MTEPIEPSGNVPELGGMGQNPPTGYEFPRGYRGKGLAPGPESGYFGPTYNIAYYGPGFGFGPGAGYGPTNWFGPNLGAYNAVTPPGGKKTANSHAHRSPFPNYSYSRPDNQIRDEIIRQLASDVHLDTRLVDVRVKDGIVTLTGRVPKRAQRQRASRDSEAVRGVWAVHNQLRVGPAVSPRTFSITT